MISLIAFICKAGIIVGLVGVILYVALWIVEKAYKGPEIF
jgi:hypothetical protein